MNKALHVALEHSLVKENNFLLSGITASIEAANLLREAYFSDKKITFDSKSSKNDLVSDIEIEVNNKIISYLNTRFPEHDIYSEEGIKNISDGYTWFIDPVDGSTNFSHKHPDFALSLGLAYEQKPICGIIVHPYSMDVYYAYKGAGSWLNGKPISVNTTVSLESALISTEFSFMDREKRSMDEYWKAFKYLYQNAHNVLISGSTVLELAYLAAGRQDAYLHLFDQLSPWDIAAALILVTEAGGTILDKNKQAIETVFSSRSILAYANEALSSSITPIVLQGS